MNDEDKYLYYKVRNTLILIFILVGVLWYNSYCALVGIG
jgi:hypothetical protein